MGVFTLLMKPVTLEMDIICITKACRRTSRLKQFMIAMICRLFSQGCLLNRLETSRQQLCDEKISLSLAERILITFYEPSLYDDDI